MVKVINFIEISSILNMYVYLALEYDIIMKNKNGRFNTFSTYMDSDSMGAVDASATMLSKVVGAITHTLFRLFLFLHTLKEKKYKSKIVL